ncbi:hypothetical protein Tco_1376203 [Tanacetum coccineum]
MVLFSESECLVLSPDLKMPDENSMNYHPVRTENQANHTTGPQEVSTSNADLKSSELKNGGDKPKENTGSKTNKEPVDDADKHFMDELAKI